MISIEVHEVNAELIRAILAQRPQIALQIGSTALLSLLDRALQSTTTAPPPD